MGYIFIRYANRDKTFAEMLTNSLSSEGFEIWQGVQPGENWQVAMEAGIVNADAMILLSSKHSATSPTTLRLVELALAHGVPVLPAVLDFPGFKNMPKPLFGLNWLDFRKGYDETLASLLERLPTSAQSSGIHQPVSESLRGYVFISYAEEDTAFVLKLRDFLRERNYSYWDYQDSDRDYHGQLHLELEEVIRDASATLSVLSPDWKLSPWTAKEYLFSEQIETPVFLLHVRTMEPTLLTAGVPYIDFVDDDRLGFNKLEIELQRKGLL